MRAAEGPASLPICAATASAQRQRGALRAGGLWLGLLLGLLLGPMSGCGDGHSVPALPPGNWVYGDARAVSAILASLETLAGTPVARSASSLRERLTGCREFIARSQGGDLRALLDRARCATPGEVPDSIVALRREGDLAFVLELAPDRQLRGRLTRAQTGAVSIVASLEAPEVSSLAALLVPGEEPVGRSALAPAETLVHARLRPASGLNVAAMVSQNSQADRMFQLRSELFLGQVLDGTWEFAIYMPRAEHVTPPIALALDYSLRPAAEAAMKRFVSELEATWPIHHSEYVIADYAGACFHDLRLLPDLVPCYVLTEQSIVIGWNPLSLSLALGPAAGNSGPTDAPFGASGGLVVHLDRLPEADRRLRRQLGSSRPGAKLDYGYVWDELRLEGTSDGERLQLRVSLEMSGAS